MLENGQFKAEVVVAVNATVEVTATAYCRTNPLKYSAYSTTTTAFVMEESVFIHHDKETAKTIAHANALKIAQDQAFEEAKSTSSSTAKFEAVAVLRLQYTDLDEKDIDFCIDVTQSHFDIASVCDSPVMSGLLTRTPGRPSDDMKFPQIPESPSIGVQVFMGNPGPGFSPMPSPGRMLYNQSPAIMLRCMAQPPRLPRGSPSHNDFCLGSPAANAESLTQVYMMARMSTAQVSSSFKCLMEEERQGEASQMGEPIKQGELSEVDLSKLVMDDD